MLTKYAFSNCRNGRVVNAAYSLAGVFLVGLFISLLRDAIVKKCLKGGRGSNPYMQKTSSVAGLTIWAKKIGGKFGLKMA